MTVKLVRLVDDDRRRTALERLLRALGHRSRTFSSALWVPVRRTSRIPRDACCWITARAGDDGWDGAARGRLAGNDAAEPGHCPSSSSPAMARFRAAVCGAAMRAGKLWISSHQAGSKLGPVAGRLNRLLRRDAGAASLLPRRAGAGQARYARGLSPRGQEVFGYVVAGHLQQAGGGRSSVPANQEHPGSIAPTS